MASEQHLHDVAIELERRRSRRGYATPADARGFLQIARQSQHPINPIATAYFRAAEEEEEEENHDATDVCVRKDDGIPTSIDAVIELLTEAGVMPERPRALLDGADEDPSTALGAGPRGATLPLLRRLMEFVLHNDEAAYLTRSRELAFLANTLLAGSSIQSRPFTRHGKRPMRLCASATWLSNAGPRLLPTRFSWITAS